MPWYQGASLLYHLETVHIASDRNLIDVRFPVQWVIRPQSDEAPRLPRLRRQVAGGVFKPGDEVVVLPSGLTSTIAKLETHRRAVEQRRSPPHVVTDRTWRTTSTCPAAT
jgi:sulfate adenylyltransferase subunit 1 (EFTu-like GTPase family)